MIKLESIWKKKKQKISDDVILLIKVKMFKKKVGRKKEKETTLLKEINVYHKNHVLFHDYILMFKIIQL